MELDDFSHLLLHDISQPINTAYLAINLLKIKMQKENLTVSEAKEIVDGLDAQLTKVIKQIRLFRLNSLASAEN